MSQINQIEVQIAEALNRLRAASAPPLGKGEHRDAKTLNLRLAELEREKADLAGELDSLRAKRDRDVAALDDLIAQLKPLIEEV